MGGDYETMSHESSGLCWCGPDNHGPEQERGNENQMSNPYRTPKPSRPILQCTCATCNPGKDANK